MQRITTATKAVNLFGVGKDGFTSGNPNSQLAPTQMSAAWCNGVQEEIATCIELSGQTLNPADVKQVAKSIPYLAGRQIDPDANDIFFEWKSEYAPTVPNCVYQKKTDTAQTTSDAAVTMCFFTPPNASYGQVRFLIAAVKVGEPSNGNVKTVVARWYKVGNVVFLNSDFVVVEQAGVGGLNFDYGLSSIAGSLALNFKPFLGENPDSTYNVHVVGEMISVKG